MIPMRDGVKLRTVILIPKGAQHAPMLLTRTPYGAVERYAERPSAHLSEVLDSTDVADDAVLNGNYIRVVQDVRGKHGSEGDYVMTRPLRGPLNPTQVDHATDTYDTIDWLVKNTPESNGKVGILGISYDGFTSLMAMFHPHPALRAAVPINAMVDGWRGDDWFHNGAFRQSSLEYAHDQEATRGSDIHWWSDHYDDYDTWLAAGSAGDMAKKHGLNQVGFAVKLLSNPAYDPFWQNQAIDKLMAKEPLTVPVMLVHSLWDQEDIYGNIAMYKALKPKDTDGNKVFLVIGPWYHHQERLDGSAIGAIKFGSDTAETFRLHILRPVPRSFPQGRRTAHRHRAGQCVRHRRERMAAAENLAIGLRQWLRHHPHAALPARRRARGLHRAGRRHSWFRQLCFRSGQAGALPAAPHPHRRRRRRSHLAKLARQRPA